MKERGVSRVKHCAQLKKKKDSLPSLTILIVKNI